MLFGVLALTCAALAAAIAGDYRDGVEAQLGELRDVVVARENVKAGRPLRPGEATKLLEVRRVPARFAPADVLTDPLEAAGRRAAAPIPTGAYVTAGLLRTPGPSHGTPGPRLGQGREAVEIAVTGAEALAAGGARPLHTAVDVVVTTEPSAGGAGGRTYVAASGVRLIDLREAGHTEDAAGLGPAGPTSWIATLAATRSQALRLIHAHNYARELRLIAAG